MMSVVALCLVLTTYFCIRVNRMEDRVQKLEQIVMAKKQ